MNKSDKKNFKKANEVRKRDVGKILQFYYPFRYGYDITKEMQNRCTTNTKK